jgi:hypothetical protein
MFVVHSTWTVDAVRQRNPTDCKVVSDIVLSKVHDIVAEADV